MSFFKTRRENVDVDAVLTQVWELVRAGAKVHPATFRKLLAIDADRKSLEGGLLEWQRSDFAALDSSWQRLVGPSGRPASSYRRAYIERPRDNFRQYRIGDQLLNVHGPGLAETVSPDILAAQPVVPGNSDLCFEWLEEASALADHLARHDVAIMVGPVARTVRLDRIYFLVCG